MNCWLCCIKLRSGVLRTLPGGSHVMERRIGGLGFCSLNVLSVEIQIVHFISCIDILISFTCLCSLEIYLEVHLCPL